MSIELNKYLYETNLDTREYIEHFSIQASELKSAFTEIKALLADSIHTRAVAFRGTKDGNLVIRAAKGIAYEKSFDIVEGNISIDFDIVTNYKDIQELLPASGLIEITLTSGSVLLSSNTIDIDLSICNLVVDGIPHNTGKRYGIDVNKLRRSLSQLLTLKYLTKVYKKNNAISFNQGIAQVKFPSLWAECETADIPVILGLSDAYTLSVFLKTARELFVEDCGSYLVIDKDNTRIALPKQINAEQTFIEDKAKFMSLVCNWSTRGLKTKVQNMYRTLGKTDATIHLFENGTTVLSESNSTRMKIKVGDTESGYLDSWQIRLELLNSILNLIGERAQVYALNNYRKIETDNIKLLIAVTN